MSLFKSLPEFFAVAPQNTERYMIYRNSVMQSTFGMVWTTNVVEPVMNPLTLHTVKVPSDYTGEIANVQVRCGSETVIRSTTCVAKGASVVLEVGGEQRLAPLYFFTNYAILPRGATPVLVFAAEGPASAAPPAIQARQAPEIFEQRHLPVAAPIAPAANGARLPTAAPVVPSLPAHIKRLVVADAISRKEVCPISQEEITEANAAVTSCGHVFEAEGIRTWLATPASRGCCPMCKQHCCV